MLYDEVIALLIFVHHDIGVMIGPASKVRTYHYALRLLNTNPPQGRGPAARPVWRQIEIDKKEKKEFFET